MDYPFDTTGLDDETLQGFNETYKTLKAKFNIEATGDIDFQLQNFEVLKDCDELYIRNAYVIKQVLNNCYVFFTQPCYKAPFAGKPKTYGDEYQPWALAYLKKDFGRVMIRPETLTDKIIELVHPIELDFKEDKAFSDTFYVLISDYQKAVNALDRNFRNAVMDLRGHDFVIEIINHTLIIGNRKPIVPRNAIHLAEFVVRICSSC